VLEQFFNISGPAAFMFVSVFVALTSFGYKIWNDLQLSKKEANRESNSASGSKLKELDGRITMIERQMKEIPKKFEEIVNLMKEDDLNVHEKFDSKVEELKVMIRDNKNTHNDNYARMEKKFELFEGKLYDLILNRFNKDE